MSLAIEENSALPQKKKKGGRGAGGKADGGGKEAVGLGIERRSGVRLHGGKVPRCQFEGRGGRRRGKKRGDFPLAFTKNRLSINFPCGKRSLAEGLGEGKKGDGVGGVVSQEKNRQRSTPGEEKIQCALPRKKKPIPRA